MYVFMNACEESPYCFKKKKESHCRASVLMSLRGRTSARKLNLILSLKLVDIWYCFTEKTKTKVICIPVGLMFFELCS